MILQNLMFPSVDNCTEEKLFFNKTAKTRYSLAEDCVYMKKKACIRFDTFYNSFSACKWFEYTNIEDIGICELTSKDVVRHPLVQRIVQAYDDYEKKQINKNNRKNIRSGRKNNER